MADVPPAAAPPAAAPPAATTNAAAATPAAGAGAAGYIGAGVDALCKVITTAYTASNSQPQPPPSGRAYA